MYSKITVVNLGEYAHQQDMIVRMFDVSLPYYRHRRIFQYHYMVYNEYYIMLLCIFHAKRVHATQKQSH